MCCSRRTFSTKFLDKNGKMMKTKEKPIFSDRIFELTLDRKQFKEWTEEPSFSENPNLAGDGNGFLTAIWYGSQTGTGRTKKGKCSLSFESTKERSSILALTVDTAKIFFFPHARYVASFVSYPCIFKKSRYNGYRFNSYGFIMIITIIIINVLIL